jgi:hypothetical protein
MPETRHSSLSEGVDSGLLGGLTVAVWFLLRDLLAGKPLLTPSVLGQFFILGHQHPGTGSFDFAAVVLYTAVHFIAFTLFGLLLAGLIRLAVQSEMARFGLLVLLVVFELGFYVVVQSASEEVGAWFPLWSVLLANLLASGVMAFYFARRHPELFRALKDQPLGA